MIFQKITFKNGSIYEGEILNRMPDGKGKLTFPDGSVYEGEFLSGKRHG